MQLLALSDVIWGAIITLIGSTVTTLSVLLVVWMQLRTKVALVKLGVDQAKAATVQVRAILGDIQKGINTSVMLTEEAVKRVESGKQQTDVAEQTIRRMAENIELSVQAFQQIVAATNQQQIGFDQVAQALKNISITTSQTAGGTRQLEKAAASINALGQQLKQSVERYRV